jgi:hypothetical protein
MLYLSIQNTLYKLENETELKKQLFAKYSPDENVEVISDDMKQIEVLKLNELFDEETKGNEQKRVDR